MELEKQVCSLELSQRLKELGVPQESLFWHHNGKILTNWEMRGRTISEEYPPISVYTVAELGEMLPSVNTKSWQTWSEEKNKKWKCENWTNDNGTNTYANTEADARAKMLIYLIENGLVDVQP